MKLSYKSVAAEKLGNSHICGNKQYVQATNGLKKKPQFFKKCL